MKIYIVTEDLGDGDVGLRYFNSIETAQEYIDSFEDKEYLDYNPCWHESNPHELDIDAIVNNKFLYDDLEKDDLVNL